MDNQNLGRIILIIIAMIFSALFSSCETAFSSVNKIRLKNYAAQGDKRAEKALKIANSFEDALTTVLVGNNIVNITMASVSTVLFTTLFGSGAVGISTAVTTVLVLIFGEILPKSYAKENAERLSLFFAGPLSFLIILFKPIIFIFNKLASILKNGKVEPSVTEDELKYIIEEIEEQGVLEEQEGDLVRSALDFDEITVNEILIPRVKVIGVEKNASIDEIKSLFIDEMYSRLPVYDKSLDNIIGMITNKRFFKMLAQGGNDITEIIQDVAHFSDLKLISEALRDMQRSKTHLAVVLDQYGGTKGIVTLEDIIEELVGEIYDENDEVIPSIVKISENEYEVSGDLSISDMLDQLGLDEDMIESTYTSVGGWVTELLEHIPEQNETAEYGAFKITVLQVKEQSVEKIRLIIDTSETEKD
ncbi:MAG: hemolysin family protein [Ruminococcus sp.]|mgnify:FL=1|nr:HlyC/CorC family transporter [Ruminococcus sp.]MCI6889886.1 hemolysin family protein [Ruminococcus sp.]MDD6633745.1 hemolysin family protein [Ruminococcus sp.]CDF02933.1 hemolysins and related proteins containing CBS domains [Ruminococcus sp. CAG:624]